MGNKKGINNTKPLPRRGLGVDEARNIGNCLVYMCIPRYSGELIFGYLYKCLSDSISCLYFVTLYAL